MDTVRAVPRILRVGGNLIREPFNHLNKKIHSDGKMLANIGFLTLFNQNRIKKCIELHFKLLLNNVHIQFPHFPKIQLIPR